MSKSALDKDSDNFLNVLKLISDRMNGLMYAFRGTAGLVIQGLEMKMEDIDIVCSKDTAVASNTLFKDFLKEKVEYKISDKFKSYFGKFNIKGVLVEIYGDWQILDAKGVWSKIFDGSDRIKVKFRGEDFYVVPADTELLMFALMGRWSAFHKIKKQASSFLAGENSRSKIKI
ncbi:hypothetical protein A3F07_00765 [candidate division WWE3 bacterium RIFCSPHIGHO2_12_FULL_38_15]|uniref:Uncharacterized protein n=1 Tax=candidate division WWE3 bacterium RIFCSPHIGHO2_02_FULL_38_14 TaxID=1802620 RepID=A0A1F4VB72_UNCKA|nr:MAG: hypothetical protein A2793_00850 [candidate division WWE3 bacterium RIFCSPHIGHO2_01_FULL_38_45]OGC49106.1 MAG: hypothetical protein A3F07_00765 [candidate division WWE3 bacterium RIFCSPHIGHO2_12_FULL_38_15]OGC53561.1 MAG: hypothetical protein A3B64_04400 [candidate division WWE3 bacterium RIFCSPLOWO2_01_FULL_37_24]OGC54465.1 MAG: hypothetical protein A3D91_01030 [candidate division WWE3 bacterium RIFCSPHIGHO2_02_FULL_38_14]HLB51711.1 hypothetical protein [Patescibacteria group bacterium